MQGPGRQCESVAGSGVGCGGVDRLLCLLYTSELVVRYWGVTPGICRAATAQG